MSGLKLDFLRLFLAVACSGLLTCDAETRLSWPDAAHGHGSRRHEGIPSVAISPENGIVWVTWYASPTGGEDSNNYVILAASTDDGKTWSEVAYADPDGSGPVRAFDPQVWVSPEGKLRWFWTERVAPLAGTNTNSNLGCSASPKDDKLMMATLESHRKPTALCESVRIARGVMMGKPIVNTTGWWVLPVANWYEEKSSGVVVSRNAGMSFDYVGGASMPKEDRLFDEHSLYEQKDGTLVCWARANSGIRTAKSTDGGRNWGPLLPSRVRHTSSRFAVCRLKSGRLLLVKNGPINQDVGRSRLMAFLSDDGEHWRGGLCLDAREGVSYPDVAQFPDGRIAVVYDRNRTTDREILFCVIAEDDILWPGKDVTVRRILITSSRSAGGQ